MELQLALDLVNIPEAIEVVKEVEEYIDIVEIGTPVVINEGLRAVKEMKAAFPNLKVLADLKIMDAAGYEVMKASEAGADIITILGAAEDMSIKGAVEEAKAQGNKILVDMIGIKDIKSRAKELDELGVDYICVHTGYDLQAIGQNSFEDLMTIKNVVKNAKTAIAGGIKLDTLPEVVKLKPDLVIVGAVLQIKTIKLRQPQNEADDPINMKTYDYVKAIIAELDHATSQNQAEGIEDLISTIMSSEKVFVSGAGRSGLMGKSFAMRLMHMGINAFVTGETVTPVFTEKDLLIVGTGSGKTESLLHMAEKAKDIGGTVATVTISPDSPIAEISDLILQLPGSPKDQTTGNKQTIQPMGSLFEQTLLLYYDAIILRIMEMKGLNTHNMYGNHANLE